MKSRRFWRGLGQSMRRPRRIRSRWIGWLGTASAVILLAGPLFDAVNALRHPVRVGEQNCRIVQVIDGDTLRLWCADVGLQTVRLTGFDTPELFSPQCLAEHWAAQRATWATRLALYRAQRVALELAQRHDRYDRLLGQLRLDGRPMQDRLIAQGLARPYDGGQRQGWCD